MKLQQTITWVTASILGLGSFSIYAAQPDMTDQLPEITIQQPPEIEAGIEVQNLPRSDQAGRNIQGSQYCTYAAYRIDKVGYNRSWPDNEVSYDVLVTNIGDCNLRDTDITDYFPSNTTFGGASPAPSSLESKRAFWRVPWLPVGYEARIRIRFTMSSYDTGRWVTNNACARNSMISQRICAWASLWEPKSY